MPGRIAEVSLITALAILITVLLALPVLRAPSERVFGAEIVGRHHDPYTVMQQLERPISIGIHAQPLTDVPGALLARALGGVAAYNWLILISFPLTAAAAYLLARHLMLSPAGAAVTALACAFSPFHLAHAAYHPHIAQVQWIPLYLLALWRCLDSPTLGAVAALVAAVAGVTLSNYYGGFIAAVISPIAVAAYWMATRRFGAQPLRRLGITGGTLLLMATIGVAYAWWTASAVIGDREAFAFARLDLFRYGARWWSYLVPPVEHPMLGTAVARFWAATGNGQGLLEQQVSLGWGVMALGLVAIVSWWANVRPAASLTRVPILVAVAVAALICSLSPEPTTGTLAVIRPSAFLYDLLPMFRSYARFGVVVQLMAAVLAGIGVDVLMRAGTRRARLVCVSLLALAAAEYSVLPSALWRDVLPTAAHRWVTQQANATRVLDCHPLTQESASVQWLTDSRVTMLSHAVSDCSEPNFAQKLAAHDYTHLLVRQQSALGPLTEPSRVPEGFRLAATFDDGLVLAVTARRPLIYTSVMAGFSPREHDREWSWRWMGSGAAWTITRTTPLPIVAALDIEASAFQHDRQVTVWLDGAQVQSLVVERARRTYRLGPFTFPHGAHELVFRATEPPAVADDVHHNGDRRPLSVAIGTWRWTVAEDQS